MHLVLGEVSPSTAGDIQRTTAFIRRSRRQGYCTNTGVADFTSIIDTADHTLIRQTLSNPNHVLAHLLPEKANTHYKLRSRQHDRQLILILNYIAVSSLYCYHGSW